MTSRGASWRGRLTRALALVLVGLLSLTAVAAAQDGGPIGEPAVGMLGSAAGLAGIIFIVMSLLRGPMDDALFDRWAPTIAVVVGIVLAELYGLASAHPFTLDAALEAALVGLFGGWFSQNVNTQVRRLTAPPTG